MRRLSQSLFAVSLLLIAGCQKTPEQSANPTAAQPPEKATPIPEQPAPVVPEPEFNTLAKANAYIRDHIANRKLSADTRGENTDHFLNNIDDAILPQLNITQTADLYEGLTDCLRPWNEKAMRISKPGEKMYWYKQSKSIELADKYEGRFLDNYSKLAATRIPNDSGFESRVNRAIEKFLTDPKQGRLLGKFKKIIDEIRTNPEKIEDPAVQKYFIDLASQIGSNFSSYVYGKPQHFSGVLDENPQLPFAMRFFYETQNFVFSKGMFSTISQATDAPVANTVELICHEAMHGVLNTMLLKDAKPKSAFLRMVKVNRDFMHLDTVANFTGANANQVYLVQPEERAVYRYAYPMFLKCKDKLSETAGREFMDRRKSWEQDRGPSF